MLGLGPWRQGYFFENMNLDEGEAPMKHVILVSVAAFASISARMGTRLQWPPVYAAPQSGAPGVHISCTWYVAPASDVPEMAMSMRLPMGNSAPISAE